MPDDLQIPLPSAPQALGRPSYRIDRRPRGLDAATRRLLAFAGGALALLLVAAGAWTMVARRPAGVPVIEADSRPLRVKPDNPGGMQVAGADEPDDAAPTLAPAPETPAPLALQAQVQANRPAPAPVAPAQPPATATVKPPASPAPAAASPAPAARAAAGTAQVQLAAVDSEEAAHAEWARLQKRLPDLLGGRQPSIQRAADKDGKSVWRVRTGAFADLADATGFCAKVRAKGAGCFLGTP